MRIASPRPECPITGDNSKCNLSLYAKANLGVRAFVPNSPGDSNARTLIAAPLAQDLVSKS